jgi:hypothetical protein
LAQEINARETQAADEQAKSVAPRRNPHVNRTRREEPTVSNYQRPEYRPETVEDPDWIPPAEDPENPDKPKPTAPPIPVFPARRDQKDRRDKRKDALDELAGEAAKQRERFAHQVTEQREKGKRNPAIGRNRDSWIAKGESRRRSADVPPQ